MDAREKVILQNIKKMLNQLEPSLNECDHNVVDTSLDVVVKRLVMMTCVNYWIYDPVTNQVTFYSIDNETHQAREHVRSFAYLLRKIDDKGRRDMLQGVSELTAGDKISTSLAYSYARDDHYDCFDVALHAVELGNHIQVIGITRSVSTSEHRMRLNVAAQKKFELLMNISNMFIWEYDVADDMFIANHALCEKLLIEERPYTMKEIKEVLNVDFFEICKQQQSKHKKEHSIIEVKDAYKKNGFIFETNFNYTMDEQHNYIFILGTLTDITEKELYKTKASRDDLTQCFNRRTADITLASSFRKYKEEGEFYTIIFLDVDNFKHVNDHYGHDAGDYILTYFSSQIQKEIRNSDMLFRWGGDEFLLICSGIAKENIYAYIDRLRKMIESSVFEYKKQRIQITTSIGAAYFYPADIDFQAAMKRADRSVYKSKLAGRNKVCILK